MEQSLNAELGLRHVVIEGIWIFAAMEACRIAVGVFVAMSWCRSCKSFALSKRSG
jgi:hypothetical protein